MTITYAELRDPAQLNELYKLIAEHSGTLARSAQECSIDYFQDILNKSRSQGINLGAYYDAKLIGFIYSYRFDAKVFEHTLANLTLGVDPDYQGKGIGQKLFQEFMNKVESDKSISRVELFTPIINDKAIKLYESLGFTKEGVLRNRAFFKGKLIDDLVMAWVR